MGNAAEMRALVALGSNLGDRKTHLEAGLVGLRDLGTVMPSPLVMETPDESGLGPAYLNTVALLECEGSDPCRLLEVLFRIELAQGRDRSAGRNAPRTLDMDLIAFEGWAGNTLWNTPADLGALGAQLSLELPHPRARHRAFVMEPWRALEAQVPPEALKGLHF